MIINKILNEKKLKKSNIILYFICLIISLFTLYSAINEYFSGVNSQRHFYSLGLFTTQNILIVNLVLLLYLINLIKKKNNSIFFSYLSLNCLANCFFVFYLSFDYKNLFDFFCEHKLLPLTFFFYYFFIDQNIISLTRFYIGFIYIFIYIGISLIVVLFEETLFPYLDQYKELDSDPCRKILMFLGIFLTIFCTVFFIIFKNKRIKGKYN